MIRGRTLLDLLLPLFLVLPAFAQSPDSDKGTVAQPTWSVGDWWDFRDGRAAWRLTVIAREGADYVLVKTAAKEPATSPDGKEKYLVSPNGVTQKIIAASGKTTDSPDQREWVRFPLSPGGASWSWIRQSVSLSGRATQYYYECGGDRWETIEIGGRKVRVFRVACTSKTRTGDGYASYAHTAWYAPDAKRLVRLESDY